MNPKPLSKELEEEVKNVTAALRRAGQRARLIAAQTHTEIVVMRNGKLVKEIPKVQERQ